MASVRTEIRDVLDTDLPADPYPPKLFDAKVQAVFDHVVTAYGDDQTSVYPERYSASPRPSCRGRTTRPGMAGGTALRTVSQLIDNDEDFAVEFKSTARWDLRENQPNKAMEDAVVKTVAGFLNTDGGTLLIGIGPNRQVVGLDFDYPRVKPPNGDGFVNWLTTHLTNALGHAAVMRTRARIAPHNGREICRLDVARSSQPVWAKTSSGDRMFFVRMNNSTRKLPDAELEIYLADHWPSGR
jgi:type I restriction enzyme R subunit